MNRRNYRIPKKLGPEEREQKALFSYRDIFSIRWPVVQLLIHVPNSGAGPLKGMAGKMKAMGVKPGVADLFLPVAKQGFHGLWIELKASGGRLTEYQKKWLAEMQSQRYKATVAIGHEMAWVEIGNYLTLEIFKNFNEVLIFHGFTPKGGKVANGNHQRDSR